MATKKNEKGTFTLAAVLDLNEASNLKANLLSLRGSPLSIDASTVERMGAQCVQVLMSAAKTWEKDGKPFLILKASDAFQTTMQLIGVKFEHLLAKE